MTWKIKRKPNCHTPKPMVETFRGGGRHVISQPMYIVSVVNTTITLHRSIYNCLKTMLYMFIDIYIKMNKSLDVTPRRSDSSERFRDTCLMRTWEYKQFKNQHKAGEFINGLFSENEQVSFGFLKKLISKKIPYFLIRKV